MKNNNLFIKRQDTITYKGTQALTRVYQLERINYMKWWFSDYDGTINLKHNDDIDKRDINFIKKWIDEGNIFTIATGKMHHEILPVLEKNQIPFNYMICNNGAVVYGADKSILAKTTISETVRQAILDKIEILKEKYIIGYCILDQRRDFSHIPTPEIDNDPFFANAPKRNNFVEGTKEILNHPDLNLIYVFLKQKDVQEVKNFLEDLPGCKVVRTHKNVLEVMNEEVSKALGIKEIQKLHNFNDEDIVASGDGENDIEMLQLANKAFTMKNHQPTVDEHADAIINNVFEIKKYL